MKGLACALPLLLGACGGGDGDGSNGGGLSCSVGDQQVWLRDNFDRNYYWYALSPKPAPGLAATVEEYFDSLLYGGGDLIPNGGGARWPFDRYSYFQSTESFERFFGAGQTLGWGVAVNGLEAVRDGASQLFVRYVEPLSPAALTGAITGGLQRGDEIIAINGTPVAELIADDDFSVLSAAAAGELLRLDVKRGVDPLTTVILGAAVYPLTPVQVGPNGPVVDSPTKRRMMGYVFVKDMIDQVQPTLGTTMASFRNQGVQELVLDMRYNGGGFVEVGRDVASYAAGSLGSAQTYARLLYNDKNAGSNTSFAFTNPNQWAGFSRVYVLVGERTCSASEQVINGLRGIDLGGGRRIDVVAIGDTTCGKPVGFNSRADGCGTTYSVVNFEGVNARNEGRYFDGLAPTCSVAEDFGKPIGALDDPLLVAAAYHVDNGVCPAGTARAQAQSKASATPAKRYDGADGGERTGMQVR